MHLINTKWLITVVVLTIAVLIMSHLTKSADGSMSFNRISDCNDIFVWSKITSTRLEGSNAYFHVIAYGLMTVLFTLSIKSFPSIRSSLIIFFGLAFIGFMDELTQPFFGRQMNIVDYAADLIAIFFSLIVMALIIKACTVEGVEKHIRYATPLVLISLICLELICRFVLGTGNPPLWTTDREVKYMMKPDQNGRQLHNEYIYNKYSMRCSDFPEKKASESELRILVIGDSVVNGGIHTKQSDLASEIIKKQLQTRYSGSAVVGNISCGSWGPRHFLSYIRKFGTFDADVAVIVLSSHDYNDYPGRFPLAGTHPLYPSEKPFCALSEAVFGGISVFWSKTMSKKPEISKIDKEKKIAKSKRAFLKLVRLLKDDFVKVIVVQHLERSELMNGHLKGYDVIKRWCRQAGVDSFDFETEFKEQLETGKTPYRDNLHINPIGQRILANKIISTIMPTNNYTKDVGQ